MIRIFYTSIEFATIWKHEKLLELGGFDEAFGIGSYYGSEEGADMIIRALNKNMKIMYYPNTITAHPNIMAPLKKTYSYALGTGALFRKHSSDQKIKTYALRIISRSFLGIFVYMWKPRKSLLYLYRFIGIFAGYFHSRNFFES